MASQADKIRQKVLRRQEMPALSALAVKLVESAADERASAADLASLIAQDPALATRLLRLVNSPIYRTSAGEVTSLDRAVVILGTRQVRIMALSVSLRDTLPLKAGGADWLLYWRACLYRASLAAALARRLERPEPEEAFLAGLILEAGLPLLLEAAGPELTAGFPGFAATLDDQVAWERRELGLEHRSLGQEIVQRWGLPGELGQCLPLRPMAQWRQAPTLARVVELARRISESLFIPGVELARIHPVARSWFSLADEEVSRLVARALSEVTATAEALEIGLDQEADLLSVMEKANRALGRLSGRMEPLVARAVQDQGQAVDSLTEVLEAVLHEIRNPLASVGGLARRLAAGCGESEQGKKYAGMIVSQAQRLDAAMREMADLAAPVNLAEEPLDLTALVGRVADALREQPPRHLPGGWPAIDWRLPPAAVRVRGDPAGLAQALLLMIEFGGHLVAKELRPQITVSLARQASWARLQVSGRAPLPDQPGPLAEKAFGPYLGLARTRRVLKAHGGRLEVNSDAGGFGLSALLPAP